MADRQESNEILLELTVRIISAYVSKNPVPASEFPSLINDVSDSMARLVAGTSEQPMEAATPAVSVKKSVTSNYLVCLEDGRKFRSLKRHLSTHHDLTPMEYRNKWGLPADYPMTAPAYSSARSALAKEIGLGRKVRNKADATPVPVKRARKPKAASGQ